MIRQLSTSYQGQPILEVSARPLFSGVTATPPVPLFQQALPLGPGGPFASTVNLPTPILIQPNTSYLIDTYLLAGSSIFNIMVGYRPPTQTFLPFRGAKPRVFDSRLSGGPLLAGASRKVAMGMPGALSAVFNLNVVSPAGSGFVTAFPANAASKAVPMVHYVSQETSNLVICPVDSSGALKLQAYGHATQAYLDLIGYMV